MNYTKNVMRKSDFIRDDSNLNFIIDIPKHEEIHCSKHNNCTQITQCDDQYQVKRPCHAKTGLEIIVIVIPKEGVAGTSPETFIWYDTVHIVEPC